MSDPSRSPQSSPPAGRTGKNYFVAVTANRRAEMLCEDAPAVPWGPQEVEGRTLYTLISAGTELHHDYLAADGFPRRPGYSAVFRVENIGTGVDDVAPGDVVFAMGKHQSRQRFNRDSIIPLPRNLPPRDATVARMMGVSWTTLTTTTARPPGKVLVTGLGMVGNMAAQVFQAAGYDVIAVESNAHRRKLARDVGIPKVLASVPADDPQMVGEVMLVVECSGHEQAVLDAAGVVKKGGEVALVGVPWVKHVDTPVFELLKRIFFDYVTVRSGWEWEISRRKRDFAPSSNFENLTGALTWLARGRVKTRGLYRVGSPGKIRQHYDDLLNGRCDALSIVLDWSSVGGR